jgi:hypothetical protein
MGFGGRQQAAMPTSYSVADLERAITHLEQVHGMSSAAFLEKWKAGSLDDSNFEFHRWHGLLHAKDDALAATETS